MSDQRSDALSPGLADRVPDGLTADDLVRLIADTPNTEAIGREDYIAFGMSAATCVRALEARAGGQLPVEREKLADAFGTWCAAWPGHKDADAFETERDKFLSDLLAHASEGSWRRLMQLAAQFGNSSEWLKDKKKQFAGSSAQAEFAEATGTDVKPDQDRLYVVYPVGFRMEGGFLVGIMSRKNKKGEWESWDVHVCQEFQITGRARTANDDGYSIAIAWTNEQGAPRNLLVPQALAHKEGGALAALLQDNGLECEATADAHKLMQRFFAGVQVSRHVLLANRCGWHQTDRGWTFLLPSGRAFGTGAAHVMLQHEHRTKPLAFAEAGTLAEWQTQIGRYAIGNSRLALRMCEEFAAPVLDITGESSAGIHMKDASRTGKTTTLRCSASVYGKGTVADGRIGTWRATANGLEAVAAAHCDLTLPLDELGQAEPREVGTIVYALANETGKARASRTGSAREAYSWRLLLQSTGEISLESKMAEAGRKATAGLDVRLAEVPADAGAGMGVFESLHGFASAAELAEHLKRAAGQFYGTAGAAFLERLTADRNQDADALREHLLTVRGEFVRRYVPAGASAQVRDVAGRFGLIAAAGELAIGYGILPWPAGEAVRAAKSCFTAWLANRGTAGSAEDFRAVAAIRQVIALHGESRFTRITKGMPVQDADGQPIETSRPDERATTRDRLGFRREGADGDFEYLFTPEGWREACAGYDPTRVARLLAEKGWLLPDNDGRNLARKVKVPGYGLGRYYVIRGSILAGGI